MTVGYKSTVNDGTPGDLRMDGFMATFVFGWHPLIEGSRRLKSEWPGSAQGPVPGTSHRAGQCV